MISNEELLILKEKISKYLGLQNLDKNDDVTSRIFQLLNEYLDIDYKKLTKSIDEFFVLKNSGSTLSYQDTENKFDVSVNDSNLKVKGFNSNGKPALYFLAGDEKKAFFKIKTKEEDEKRVVKIEIASNSEILSNFKRGIHHNESNFVYQEKFVLSDGLEKCECDMMSYANGVNETELNQQILCDDYANFLKFFNAILVHNKQKPITNLTNENAELIFCQLYHPIKNMFSNENEFTISELVLMLDTVINDNKSKFGAVNQMDISFKKSNLDSSVDVIRDFYKTNSKENGKDILMFESKDGVRYLKLVSADGYLSIDVFNEKDDKLAGYILGTTDRGFTLFKNSKDKDSGDSNMITLNISDNILKARSEIKDSQNKPEYLSEYIMTVSKDGGIVLNSSMKFFYENELVNEKVQCSK